MEARMEAVIDRGDREGGGIDREFKDMLLVSYILLGPSFYNS